MKYVPKSNTMMKYNNAMLLKVLLNGGEVIFNYASTRTKKIEQLRVLSTNQYVRNTPIL